MARLAVAVNPQIENNPAWEPYLEAVRARRFGVILESHPTRLRPVVALALSVAKWHLIMRFGGGHGGSEDCGCCVYYKSLNNHCLRDACPHCPLGPSPDECVGMSTRKVYSRILRIYTKHFNALPERDKQRLAA